MVEYYIRLFQSSKLHSSHKLLLTLLQLLKQSTTIFSPVSLPFLILFQLPVLSFLVYPLYLHSLTKDQSTEHRTRTTHFMSIFSKENKTFTRAYQKRLYYRLYLEKKQPPNFCCKIQSKCILGIMCSQNKLEVSSTLHTYKRTQGGRGCIQEKGSTVSHIHSCIGS